MLRSKQAALGADGPQKSCELDVDVPIDLSSGLEFRVWNPKP